MQIGYHPMVELEYNKTSQDGNPIRRTDNCKTDTSIRRTLLLPQITFFTLNCLLRRTHTILKMAFRSTDQIFDCHHVYFMLSHTGLLFPCLLNNITSLLCCSKPFLILLEPQQLKSAEHLAPLVGYQCLQNLSKMDTSIRRRLKSVAKGVRLKRFYCSFRYIAPIHLSNWALISLTIPIM